MTSCVVYYIIIRGARSLKPFQSPNNTYLLVIIELTEMYRVSIGDGSYTIYYPPLLKYLKSLNSQKLYR